MTTRRMGVEEEMFLIDPKTRRLAGVSSGAVAATEGDIDVTHELFQQQIETSTSPTSDADDLRRSLCAGRRATGEAAAAAGARAVAMPTPILPQEGEQLTPDPRYRRMHHDYGELTSQSLVCGMHVHVDVASDEEGIRVIDAIRPWLPLLLALSVNSPYWAGRDTGHASWRSQIVTRWPTAGPKEPFETVATYRRVNDTLLAMRAGFDPGMLYYDIRLSAKFPTVEIRIADVCTEIDDAVLVALLARALVTTAARREGRSCEPYERVDVLRAASWHAARYGLSATLWNPPTGTIEPVRAVFGAAVAHTGQALDHAGDRERVLSLFERLMARGSGATRQRSVYESTGNLARVVDDLADRTEMSWTAPRVSRQP